MKTLFFRIFISFWLAMAVILASTIGITAAISSYRYSKLGAVDPGELVSEATDALAKGGSAGLGEWLEAFTGKHRDLDVYIVGPDGRDALGRRLPDHIVQWLALGGRTQSTPYADPNKHAWSYGYDFGPGGVSARRLALNRSHLLANPTILAPDGRAYTMVVAWYGGSPVDVIGSSYATFVLLALALAVSAVVCWWVARYISRPVTGLQRSARELAAGNLDAQVDPQFSARRDELGTLARDFNRMATELRSQISAKEMLIRDISHELRSPLTRLRVALALARRGDNDLETQLERIERDLERLDALIGDTLQLSRLSGAEPALIAEEIELRPFLEELIAGARLEAAAQDKTAVLSPISARSVCVDPVLLHRAIDNVLRNAIRFTPRGTSVVLSVTEEPSHLEIVVRDHGPGVAPQHLSRIFEAFYRVDESRERTSGGAGLGLAITTRILALHGGSAEARNAADGGLEVILRLPHASRAAKIESAPAGSPIREAPALSYAPET